MDPKSRAFKAPDPISLTPELGAKLVAWVAKDMERAKKARERAEAERAKRRSGRKE